MSDDPQRPNRPAPTFPLWVPVVAILAVTVLTAAGMLIWFLTHAPTVQIR